MNAAIASIAGMVSLGLIRRRRIALRITEGGIPKQTDASWSVARVVSQVFPMGADQPQQRVFAVAFH
jgi:hypothetical protein